MREHGDPIGRIGKNMRIERERRVNNHNCYKDKICRKNCLDVCIDYCNKSAERSSEEDEKNCVKSKKN